MKLLFNIFMYLFLSVLFISCGSNKSQENKCTSKLMPEEKLDSLQVGYTFDIPKSWDSYFGYHCIFTHSPKEKEINKRVRVYSSMLQDSLFSAKFKNVDDFTNHNIKRLRKIFLSPKIEISILFHKKYGEYRIVKFGFKLKRKVSINKVSVYFFYKKKGYIINYDAHPDYFEKYEQDFVKMITSLI